MTKSNIRYQCGYNYIPRGKLGDRNFLVYVPQGKVIKIFFKLGIHGKVGQRKTPIVGSLLTQNNKGIMAS